MTQPNQTDNRTRLAVIWMGTLELSDRPSDYLMIEVDRKERRIRLREPNGAIYVDVPCPAVAAGARPEDMQ